MEFAYLLTLGLKKKREELWSRRGYRKRGEEGGVKVTNK